MKNILVFQVNDTNSMYVKVYWWWQSFTISVSNTLHGRAILLAPGGPHSGLNSEKKVCLMYYLSICATKNLKVFGAITRRTHTNYLILDFFLFVRRLLGKAMSLIFAVDFPPVLQLFTQIMQLHSTQKKKPPQRNSQFVEGHTKTNYYFMLASQMLKSKNYVRILSLR